MIYRFSLLSDEATDFRREIKIDSDATFLDLYNIIIKCCDYEKEGMASFFICDEGWRKKQEISLEEIDTDSDIDVFIMEEELLTDWIDEEGQRLIFMFDYNNGRGFYMEISEMIIGEYLSKPICSEKRGATPPQFLEEIVEEEPKTIPSKLDVFDDEEDLDNEIEESFDENLYNEDDIDISDLGDIDEDDFTIDNDIDEDVFGESDDDSDI